MNMIAKLVRPEILELSKYEVKKTLQETLIYLNRNENPWAGYDIHEEIQLNRYPDSEAIELVDILSQHLCLEQNKILLSRGSDEAIDLIIRIFCTPNKESILILSPTFGMYEFYAKIHGAKVQSINRNCENFSIDVKNIIVADLSNVKVVFICTPNNPTGNIIDIADIRYLCNILSDRSIIVIDEAYIEFSDSMSSISLLKEFQNLIILRTLSKAYGMAGIRCGITLACPFIISLLRKIISPYPLSSLTLYAAKQIFNKLTQTRIEERITIIKQEREKLIIALSSEEKILKVWPSQGNFVLVELDSVENFLQHCRSHNLVLRDVSKQINLNNCVRISVGSSEENRYLLEVIRKY